MKQIKGETPTIKEPTPSWAVRAGHQALLVARSIVGHLISRGLWEMFGG